MNVVKLGWRIPIMMKTEQEKCPHDLKYRTFALVAGRSYTNCTKCDKSWETTNFINPFNIEGFSKYTNKTNQPFYRMSIRLKDNNYLVHYNMWENEIRDIIKELEELIK
jgi:hypothetical protein